VWRLEVALGIGLLIYLAYLPFGRRRMETPRLDLRSAIWLPPYLAGIAVISYLGRYDGRNLLPFWVDIAVVAAFSIAIFALAIAVRLPAPQAQEYIALLAEEEMEEQAALDGADAPLAREGAVATADEPLTRDRDLRR
jgi:hypothetical protein